MMDLEIKGFIETSFLDWDGKVVSTLFLPRCNFRCPFCHNAGLIENPQSYKTVPADRVIKYLVEHQDFIDGICLTGGEPCLHKNQGLFEFLKRVKELGFGVKFDTNGADPECLKEIIENKLVDYIAMDVKAPLDQRYDRLAGTAVNLANILESIKLIKESELPYEFRTTVVPGLVDTPEVAAIAQFLSGAEKFVLQQFVPKNAWDERLRDLNPYPKEKMDQLVKTAQKYLSKVLVRGI